MVVVRMGKGGLRVLGFGDFLCFGEVGNGFFRYFWVRVG